MPSHIDKDLKILFSVMVQTGAKASHQQKINRYLNQPLDYQNQIAINRYGLILHSKTEVIEYIHKLKLSTRIIALTAFDEEAMIFNLMRAGVPGILFKKSTHQQEIYTAIITVLEGKHYYHEKVNIVLQSKPDGLQHPPRIKLSAREFEVIVLLGRGLNTKDIAEKLFLSEHTIEGYRKDILRKTNTKNTNELIHFALGNGIISS